MTPVEIHYLYNKLDILIRNELYEALQYWLLAMCDTVDDKDFDVNLVIEDYDEVTATLRYSHPINEFINPIWQNVCKEIYKSISDNFGPDKANAIMVGLIY